MRKPMALTAIPACLALAAPTTLARRAAASFQVE